MKVLLDANIVITYISKRDDKYQEDIERIIRLCQEERLECYIAFHTLSIAWYTMRKIPNQTLRESLFAFCGIVDLASAEMNSVRGALSNTAFRDFEDNLQDCCARSVGADCIVTANVRDYEGRSAVKAVTPSELLSILNATDDSYTAPDSSLEVREQFVEYNATQNVIPVRPHLHIMAYPTAC